MPTQNRRNTLRPLAAVLAAASLLSLSAGCGGGQAATAEEVPKPATSTIMSGVPSAAVASTPATSTAPTAVQSVVVRPAIVKRSIDFGPERRAQMRAYSTRRYGDGSLELDPKAIVLHYTAGGTAESVWAYFNANVPNGPNGDEPPGVVAHFVVDQDGTIYQLLPLTLRGRHTVGLNHVAIGIEFVQDAGSGNTWATNQIFARDAQITAGVQLVHWLQQRYGIPQGDVLGHGTANESRYFFDLTGWKNDHGDWGATAMRKFQRLLRTAAAAEGEQRAPK